MDPRLFLLMSGGWAGAVVTPPVLSAPLSRLRVSGRHFVNEAGIFRPRFASALSILMRTPAERVAVLDELARLGFNGIRLFAGDLGWAGQSPAVAWAILPDVLEDCAARGLYVYVCAITGGKDPFYDIEDHLRRVATDVAAHPNALLEVANEIGHPTLSDKANDIPGLLAMAKRAIPTGVVWTLGAPVGTDEPTPDGVYPTAGGMFNDAHLDRGRDTYNQVRRLRELYAVSETTKTPVFSGEPIGADEQMGGATGTRQRRNDPEFFFALGALSRGFELATVFHSEAGLWARPFGPVQRQCAEAFLEGWRLLDGPDVLQFQNAGWSTSPLRSADFDALTRAYSFVAGNRGFTVLIGLHREPRLEWQNGWTAGPVAGGRGQIQILSLRKP